MWGAISVGPFAGEGCAICVLVFIGKILMESVEVLAPTYSHGIEILNHMGWKVNGSTGPVLAIEVLIGMRRYSS